MSSAENFGFAPDPAGPLPSMAIIAALVAGQKDQMAIMTPAEKAEEQRAVEREVFDAVMAIAVGLKSGLIGVCGIATLENKTPICEVLVRHKGGEKMEQFSSLSHVDAVMQAGKAIHEQLMFLHGKTGKLNDYVQHVALRSQLRAQVPAEPSTN